MKSRTTIMDKVFWTIKQTEAEINYLMGRPIKLLMIDSNDIEKSKLVKEDVIVLIKRTIEKAFGIEEYSISKRSRLNPYPECRFAYMYLHRKYFPSDKLLVVAKSLDLSDHTGAVYGIKKHNELYMYDSSYRTLFNQSVDIINETINKYKDE
jgi:chromosomal replication initiation ATPase DnaA